MFDALRAEENREISSKLTKEASAQEFLTLWKAFKAETIDKIRLRRLEVKVDEMWSKLPQDQKDALARELFPGDVTKAMDVFQAHAVSIK